MTPDNLIDLLKGAAVGLVIAAVVITIYMTAPVNTIDYYKNLFR